MTNNQYAHFVIDDAKGENEKEIGQDSLA